MKSSGAAVTPDLEALLDRSGWARRLARRLVGDADADDLVQEAAIAALRNPPGTSASLANSASSERSLRKWLARVLANAARQKWRAGFRRRDLESRIEQRSSELGPEELGQRLEAHRAERDAWRESARSALEGLGRAIDARFDAWHLTPAERDVALLLLQGHGHKQIAAMTQRSERTVRQHAVAVYEKSGLRGRAELAAFFLGDLRLPEARRSEPAPR